MIPNESRPEGNQAAGSGTSNNPSIAPEPCHVNITLARFDNRSDNKPKPETLPWAELVPTLLQHSEREDKDGALFSPVTYAAGAKRGNAGVVEVWGYVADCDHGRDWGQLNYPLAGYEYVICSTHRHTPEQPRYRVVLPFARPIPVAHWADVWQRVNISLFGGNVDSATSDPAHMFYFPSCPPGALRVATHNQGRLLDPYELPPVAEANGHKRAEPVGEIIPYGKQHPTLVSIAGSMRARGLGVDEIDAALQIINATRCERPGRPEDIRRKYSEDICRYAPNDAWKASRDGALTEPKAIIVPSGTLSLAEVVIVFQTWLHLPDASAVKVGLATIAANRRPGDPVWMLLVNPPGGGKTEIITSLASLPDVFIAAVLTEAALLSGTSHKDRSKQAEGGLLRLIGVRGIIALKDLSALLSMHRDARGPILAALRQVYDGEWVRRLGVDGGRTLEWRGKCGLIGGATPSIDRHHSVVASLGERFCLFRLPEDARPERTRKALAHSGHEDAMRAELAGAVVRFFAGVDLTAGDTELSEGEVDWLVNLADLAVQLRSPVERDAYSASKEVIDVPGAEAPTRLAKVLAQLFGGLLAIGVDRGEAWALVRKVAFDSTPAIRRKAFEAVVDAAGAVTTSRVATAISLPTNTVKRALEDLAAYELVTRTSQGTGCADVWRVGEWAGRAYRNTLTSPQIWEDRVSYAPSIITNTPLDHICGEVTTDWEANDDDAG